MACVSFHHSTHMQVGQCASLTFHLTPRELPKSAGAFGPAKCKARWVQTSSHFQVSQSGLSKVVWDDKRSSASPGFRVQVDLDDKRSSAGLGFGVWGLEFRWVLDDKRSSALVVHGVWALLGTHRSTIKTFPSFSTTAATMRTFGCLSSAFFSCKAASRMFRNCASTLQACQSPSVVLLQMMMSKRN